MTTQDMLQPPHLRNASQIGHCFGVNRATVLGWVKAGAPIFLVGRKYQASYARLVVWLEQQYCRPCS